MTDADLREKARATIKLIAGQMKFRDSYERDVVEVELTAALRDVQREAYHLATEHAAQKCEAERLEDPQVGTSDDAYEQAITDCAAAIRGQEPR